MNVDKTNVFLFDGSINDDQLLRTYIETSVKYNTLEWFLYFEDFFIEHTNTSLLDLSTPMKAFAINESSSNEEMIKYFIYLKACHLGIEYIEHALKCLLLLADIPYKDIKKSGVEHNLKKHFDMLKDDNVKSIIRGSVGFYDEEFLENILKGIPTNEVVNPLSDEEQESLEKDIDMIFRATSNKQLTEEEQVIYQRLQKEMDDYETHKYDKPAQVSNKYFDNILVLISNGLIELRYPEISDNCNYYNLDIILSICKSISFALEQKFEKKHLLESQLENKEKYIKKIIEDNTPLNNYSIDKDISIIDRPLTDFEKRKMAFSNKAKYMTLFWYMYGVEQFYLSGKTDYWASIGDLLQTTSLKREKVSTKSNDKSIYDNYLYYQACHLASEYIEHSLKKILLENGYTYKDVKDNYSHNFDSMFYALPQDVQNRLKNVVSYFNDDYLSKAVRQSADFRDDIKRTDEEKQDIKDLWRWADLCYKKDYEPDQLTKEELEFIKTFDEKVIKNIGNNSDYYEKLRNLQDKYFPGILNKIKNAFKETRYPDFYNFNLDYKYCLKFLLAFSETLNSEVDDKTIWFSVSSILDGLGEESKKGLV